MRVRFLWLFVCLFGFALHSGSVCALVQKPPKPTTPPPTPPSSGWKKGETPKTGKKGPEIGTRRKPSPLPKGVSQDAEPEEEVTGEEEEGAEEEAGAEKETGKKKTSKVAKVGKVIKEITENPTFTKLLDFGLGQAGATIQAERDRKDAEAKAKAEEEKRKADLEYEKQRLAIQREDEIERLKIEKARRELELSEKRRADAKKRLEEAKKRAGESEELTGEIQEEVALTAEEEQSIEEAVPELSGYPKVLKEDFEGILADPDSIGNADQFVNNLKTFIYINIGGEPGPEDPQELKDSYSSTQKFLVELVKAISDGKIKGLQPKLTEIKELKAKMSKIELADFLIEAKKIIANHKSNKFPIENQTLFLRGIAEWAYYVTSLKKAEKLNPADETQFIEILKSIPFGKEVTAEAIKQLEEVKKK